MGSEYACLYIKTLLTGVSLHCKCKWPYKEVMNDTQRGGLSYCLTGGQCLMATFGQTFVQVYIGPSSRGGGLYLGCSLIGFYIIKILSGFY